MALSFAKGDANNISTQDSFLQTQEPIQIWEKSPPWRVTNSRWWRIYILYRIKMIFWAVIRICFMMKKWGNSNHDLKIDCYQALGRDNICNLLLSQVWSQFLWFKSNKLPDELYVLKRAPIRCSESSREYIQRVRFLQNSKICFVCSGSKGI